jgi:ribosomal protein S18 acetylase RimI-like enzyme
MSEGPHPLDNAVWRALGSRHRALALERGRARAYRSDVSVFAALESFDPASWADLAEVLGPSRGCAFLGGDVPPDLPSGWAAGDRVRCVQMVLESGAVTPVVPVPVRPLTLDDVPAMLDLVARTEPGPFRPRTIELGSYYGHFEGGDLVAMAGERLGFDGYTEISAVCTDQKVQGRGLGSTLTHHLASGILARGEQPFLHVAEANTGARRVYEKLGFVQRWVVEAVLVKAPPRPTPGGSDAGVTPV